MSDIEDPPPITEEDTNVQTVASEFNENVELNAFGNTDDIEQKSLQT